MEWQIATSYPQMEAQALQFYAIVKVWAQLKSGAHTHTHKYIVRVFHKQTE